ncbi:MAG: hypothetical protein HKN47_15370 [Pirellulaceae bacterium]|nr:hypothetical protein [Pirellulaceae bacterium]
MSEAHEEYTEREFIVATDGKSIPMCDMAPPGLLARLLGKSPPSPFAVEAARIIRVESEQVPKRILNHFREVKTKVGSLRYKRNYYATVPTIGPLAMATMSMTTSSGLSSFFAVRTVLRRDGKLIDSGFHGFCSFLAGDDILITMTQARLPRPREGVDRVMLKTEDPEVIVREHRKRMREYEIVPTEAADVVDLTRRQNELDLEEYFEQGLLRLASTGEVSRIRDQAKRK